MAFQASRDIEISSSLGDVMNNFELVLQAMIGVTPELLLEILEPILEQAQIYCPWKTGALRNSGFIDVSQQGTGGVVEAVVGFAPGGEPPYAILVHEDLTRYHVPPTRAKFLQQAIDEIMPNIEDQIYRKYKQAVKWD